jgi:hypothetical protein
MRVSANRAIGILRIDVCPVIFLFFWQSICRERVEANGAARSPAVPKNLLCANLPI